MQAGGAADSETNLTHLRAKPGLPSPRESLRACSYQSQACITTQKSHLTPASSAGISPFLRLTN